MSAGAPAVPADARRALLLALADDELVTGHRTSHWTGVAPSIEEDLAFSTIAQDEINHADVWYQVLLGPGHTRAEVDALGLGRPPEGYRHARPCAEEPGDFARSLARHWLYDLADDVRLEALRRSSDADVAAVAARLRHEERWHLEHADLWVGRLARGGDEPREHLASALAATLADATWLFEPLPGEADAVAAGLLPEPMTVLLERWADRVAAAAAALGLAVEVPPGEFDAPGGRRGVHTPAFTEDVWPELTALYRAHPGATW